MSNQELFTVSLDAGAIIVDFNETASLITGYTKEEVIGKNWFEVFIDDCNIIEVLEVFSNIFHGRNSTWEFTNEITCKDGSIKTLKWENTIIRDNHNKPELVRSQGSLIN